MTVTTGPQTNRIAWGKADVKAGVYHHLAHHSADVTASFLYLLERGPYRSKAEKALARPLAEEEITGLATLVFLHDIGKLAPGFQAKAWPEGHGLRLRGHLECGWHWTRGVSPASLAGAAAHLFLWQDLPVWLQAVFAHHGRPVASPFEGQGRGLGTSQAAFPTLPDYDWKAQETILGEALQRWLPGIVTGTLPEAQPAFVHFICGLLNLADWIGSDRRAFPFEADFRDDYWDTAQENAARRIAEIGLGTPPALKGAPDWRLISDHPAARPAQEAVGRLAVDEPLVVLEAETGSGKTEAALWRFATLLATGKVDALYFAVPTRAAARQLQRRVNEALARMFDAPLEALLAIPGQVVSGEAEGRRLADFSMLWDDSRETPARWAAEHSARYLAARVAVGTVDQVALGGLQVKFAHLRGTTLSRALLVIDEVHASDIYMREVQHSLVRSHLDLGGHVLLMSATLGTDARRKWRREPAMDLPSAIALPYPALWTSRGVQPIRAEPAGAKTVEIGRHAGWSGQEAAGLAVEAARQGARVLLIRNTVARAQETFAAIRARAPELLLSVKGVPTLHHSRFAVEDRALLDRAVEVAIGKDSPLGGRIVLGTQTLEQSLDLCADFLITDLCPMDVLLQRLGRLHRHKRPRPAGFETARAVVLTPENGLDPLVRMGENGLGAYGNGPSLSGVYVDVPGLAATLEQIETQPVWQIPAMSRALVEAATHPEALDRIARVRGWEGYRLRITGKALAEMQAADLVLLDRKAPLGIFPDDERIRTRLGEEGAILQLPPGTVGAFGDPISRIALPAHWSHGLSGEEEVAVDQGSSICLTVSDMVFSYGPGGLERGGGQ